MSSSGFSDWSAFNGTGSSTLDDKPPSSTSNFREFISRFDISYDDDQPYGSLKELTGQSADINKGCGGSPNLMIDSLWIDIRSEPEDGRQDLAQGAGGKHRYLSWSNNMNANEYVTDVALWRSGNAEAYPPHGWSHKSSDINDGRSGDYLYIVWRTKEYIRPKDY